MIQAIDRNEREPFSLHIIIELQNMMTRCFSVIWFSVFLFLFSTLLVTVNAALSENEVLDRDFLKNLVKRLETFQDKVEDKIQVSAEDLEEALRVGEQHVRDWEGLEFQKQAHDASDRHGTNPKSSKHYRPSLFYSKQTNPELMTQSKEASVNLVARTYLSEKLGIPANKIDISAMKSERDLSNATNRQSVTCSSTTKFRTMDGTCNSLENPLFGKSKSIYGRLINNVWNYYDSVSTIRRSVNSRSPLPSARLISTTVMANESVPSPDLTLLTMQFGQFLDHDLTQTPFFTKADGSPIECCSAVGIGGNLANLPSPECLPIDIPSNDPFYNPSGNGAARCMNLVRSVFGKNLDGSTPNMREQINALTHWIDGSNVYGSDLATSMSLRDTASGKGKLKTFTFNYGRHYLPLGSNCNTVDSICFAAGDNRVNQQPLLTIMHTLWVREHNRIAENLLCQTPGESDEYYFQHARRIVIAEMQHIIYNEYLPAILGPQLAAQVNAPEFSYSTWFNPAIFTEFSTAAFRMGHSQLSSFIRLFEMDGRKSNSSYLFSNSFDKPSRMLTTNFFDNALRGLMQTSAMAVDNCFADDLTNRLLKPKNSNFGLDLVSLNIQRGRDHGLPPYIFMLGHLTSNYIYGSVQYSFEYLKSRFPEEVVSAFRTVYESVYDIDLYIGGVTEKHMPNAAFGPTFASIIAYQFLRLRRADRFFYNFNVGQATSLSNNQFAEIEKVSLARIICDNSDGTILKIQPKVFRKPDELLNKPVPCHVIPGITFANLSPL